MLCVDECRNAALLLCFSDDMQCERRLAGRFRAKDLNDAPAGDTTHAECVIKSDRAGRDSLHRNFRCITELDDRTFTKLRLDRLDGRVDACSAGTFRLTLSRLLFFFYKTCHGDVNY